jgi:hypothetical protein
MSSLHLSDEISRITATLNSEQQQQVLNYIYNLQRANHAPKPTAELLALAGTLRPEEAAEMMQAIEEGCGQINPNAW